MVIWETIIIENILLPKSQFWYLKRIYLIKIYIHLTKNKLLLYFSNRLMRFAVFTLTLLLHQIWIFCINKCIKMTSFRRALPPTLQFQFGESKFNQRRVNSKAFQLNYIRF